jgi:hypothetical protein
MHLSPQPSAEEFLEGSPVMELVFLLQHFKNIFSIGIHIHLTSTRNLKKLSQSHSVLRTKPHALAQATIAPSTILLDAPSLVDDAGVALGWGEGVQIER